MCAFAGGISRRIEFKVASGQWTHVAMTWDSQVRCLSVYRNGQLLDAHTLDSVRQEDPPIDPFKNL